LFSDAGVEELSVAGEAELKRLPTSGEAKRIVSGTRAATERRIVLSIKSLLICDVSLRTGVLTVPPQLFINLMVTFFETNQGKVTAIDFESYD
jgi:hypothetical protein